MTGKLLLVSLAALFMGSLSMDPSCMTEMASQRGCFWNILRSAFGINEDIDMMTARSTVTSCFTDAGCKAPGVRKHDHHRVKREHHQTEFQKDFHRVKDCVEEEIGEEPFAAINNCVQTETGQTLPKFMMKPPKSGFTVLHNTKCPYLRLMKYIAAMSNMEQVMTGMCGGDSDKVTQVQTCVQDGLGVDIMNIDRDAVKEAICSNKDECNTEKLVECRENIADMLMAACTCRNQVAGDATTTCAERLDITLPELFTMSCEDLQEHNSRKYNMCHADFEWPTMDKIMGHKHGQPKEEVVSRKRRHEHTHDHVGHTGEASHEHEHSHDH